MVRKKDKSSTPQSSTTGSSSSGSSSSSSSGSSSSESSSSSDTEASSAVSTRSRTRSRGASSEKDASKSFPSLIHTSQPPSKKTSSSSQKAGGVSKKGEKGQFDSFPQFPCYPAKRASSESAPEPVCNSNKRGPKTTATSVPKSHANTKTKSSVLSTKRHQSNSIKPQPSKKAYQTKSTTKKPSIAKEVARDKKHHRNPALSSVDNSSESERDARSHKIKNVPKTLITPGKSIPKSHLTSKLSFLSQKQPAEKAVSRKLLKTPVKSPGVSTNSSISSSGSDSDSCSESSQAEREKSASKKDTVSSETEKEYDDTDQQQENSSRRLVTRSSSVKTKRSSLLGINKAGTDSDSENVSKPRRGNRPSELKKCSRPLITHSQFDMHDTYVHDPPSKVRSNVKKQTIKVKNNMLENVPLPPIEKRNCPVEGCDSTGHLGGLYERHFTVDACPVFRNLNKEDCKKNRILRLQENEERERASALSTKSPRHSQKMEQRNYCNKIRDSRDRMSEVPPGDEDMADSDRQPSLYGLTPNWDLQLFLQAQAEASEKIENEMSGLPDTKGIRYIQMGHFEMEAWYLSQYPDDYNQQPKIYVCEFCLKYMRSKTILMRHADKCVWKHPPGDEIYRKEKLSVWEVDGTKYKTYCQNLCLLAMLFLDHKTLYYDVEPFLFYIMTIADAEGCHIVGYFSKEKNSFLNYNVSCIMTLPPYQRQGFGRLLIDFSYLLTREEDKIGSPEKPLSDLGLISYRSYWKDLLLKHLSNFPHKNVSIKDLSGEMAVSSYDIVSTFQAMGMMKYWKGKHILLKRQDLFEDFQERTRRRCGANKEIDPNYLNWRPYVPPIRIEDPNAENKEKNKGGNDKKRPADVRSGSGESATLLPVKSKRPLIHHLTNGE